jgi:hypothetical protein
MKPVRISSVVLAIVCFFLPWISIRCDHPNFGQIDVQQSGLQAALGDASLELDGKPATERQIAQVGIDEYRADGLWPLWIYLTLLCLALVFAFAIRHPNWNWLLFTSLSGLAAIILLALLVMGFPCTLPVTGEAAHYTVWFCLALSGTLAAPILALCEKVRLEPPPVKVNVALDMWEKRHSTTAEIPPQSQAPAPARVTHRGSYTRRSSTQKRT